MPHSLADLPVEILNHITSNFETARTYLHLSLTCKNLHAYVESDGYRTFLHTRFPSFQVPPYWRDAAHTLTTLSRAWDRKALVARCIYPEKDVVHLPSRRAKPAQGRQRKQTIGYQPVIDCYEEENGNSWLARREVLAWGAGAELCIRVKSMGGAVESSWAKASDAERTAKYDNFHHRQYWVSYKDDTHHDGGDDITSANLLRSWQKPADGSEHVIIGRASGELACVRLSAQKRECRILARYRTTDRHVRSAHVSSAAEPLLAACLSSGTIAVYPVHSDSFNTKPYSELNAVGESASAGRIWTTRFLSPERLAVGLGPSKAPIQIYDICASGISPTPLRKFSFPPLSDRVTSHRMAIANRQRGSSNTPSSNPHLIPRHNVVSRTLGSVYSIVPLQPSAKAGSAPGTLFLSGWYDGALKIHDLRSHWPHVAVFTDPIDNFSPIYSILPIGHERVVVGVARQSLIKIFDLRMAGDKVYYAANAEPSDPLDAPATSQNTSRQRLNYNVYLGRRQSRSLDSPVYALASGAAYSPHIYAGIEGTVIQLDVVSMRDRFPDQVFGGRNWVGLGRGGNTMKERYDPDDQVLKLAAVQHKMVGGVMMGKQVQVGSKGGNLPGWDERWI